VNRSESNDSRNKGEARKSGESRLFITPQGGSLSSPRSGRTSNPSNMSPVKDAQTKLLILERKLAEQRRDMEDYPGEVVKYVYICIYVYIHIFMYIYIYTYLCI
jgi:hypothetical protein